MNVDILSTHKNIAKKVETNQKCQTSHKRCLFPQVGCDGGGGALGHPKVYINLDDGEPHGCIYCGLRFQLDPKAAAAAH